MLEEKVLLSVPWFGWLSESECSCPSFSLVERLEEISSLF